MDGMSVTARSSVNEEIKSRLDSVRKDLRVQDRKIVRPLLRKQKQLELECARSRSNYLQRMAQVESSIVKTANLMSLFMSRQMQPNHQQSDKL